MRSSFNIAAARLCITRYLTGRGEVAAAFCACAQSFTHGRNATHSNKRVTQKNRKTDLISGFSTHIFCYNSRMKTNVNTARATRSTPLSPAELFGELLNERQAQCPQARVQPTETEFYASVGDALAAVAPAGSTVYAVGFDSLDGFLRAGYRVSGGDADVAIARGGEREFAKARTVRFRKLVLAPTHAHATAASPVYRATDGAFGVMLHGDKPDAAVFDKADIDRNLASVFGELVALDLCAFDLAFGARMRGDAPDVRLCAEVGALVSATTAALKNKEKNRAAAAEILTDAGMKAARLVERVPALLHASGAAQTAEAVRMLYAAEERPLGMRGETEMLLSAVMTDFYVKNLGGDTLAFPPDNNRRIDSVCEYFNTDLRRACVYMSAVYPPLKMRLCEYRRAEFRGEQMKLLAEVKNRQAAAKQVFKRLYPDDGYGLKTLVEKPDLGLCLSLAPDVFAADSMLTFLKQTGRLDKYMV